MREATQFVIGLVVGMFIWRVYSLISMAADDGLGYFGVADPYVQSVIVILILGVVIFVGVHMGSRKLMDWFG